MNKQTWKKDITGAFAASQPSPKVSIVIPSYNRAKYIQATIDSVIAQTYSDFELIFVDDGSTDETAEIISRYTDPRIRYIKQKNSERAVARSLGMSLAKGKYICLVDSDDIWYPIKLEKQVNFMDANLDIGLVYASVNRIDFDGKRIKSSARQHEGYSGNVFEKLLMRNFVPSVTPMIRREFIESVGAQNTEYIPYEDWDFWLRLSCLTKFAHIKEPLGDYRIHPQQSVQNVNAGKIEEVTFKVLENNLAKATEGIRKKAISQAHLRCAYWYILADETSSARQHLNKCLEISSQSWTDPRVLGLYSMSFLVAICPQIKELIKKILGSFH